MSSGKTKEVIAARQESGIGPFAGGQQEDLPIQQDVAAALKTIDPLWAELFPTEKERIVRLLAGVSPSAPTASRSACGRAV